MSYDTLIHISRSCVQLQPNQHSWQFSFTFFCYLMNISLSVSNLLVPFNHSWLGLACTRGHSYAVGASQRLRFMIIVSLQFSSVSLLSINLYAKQLLFDYLLPSFLGLLKRKDLPQNENMCWAFLVLKWRFWLSLDDLQVTLRLSSPSIWLTSSMSCFDGPH